jgi:hypothetical protein
MENISATDTPTIYLAVNRDSGYICGTDAYGDMGFAERYDWNTGDSTVKVLGVVSIFSGKVNPATTKTVKFYTWKAAAQSATSSATVFNSGLPGLAIDSVTVGLTHLGIRSVDTVSDTFKTYWFPAPTAQLNASFFVGYTINYSYTALAGDTIAVYYNRDGERASNIFNVVGADTIINKQNTTMYNDGTWHDNATDNFVLAINYFIFPVISAHRFPASVNGITNKNFTFFGNYPNPATTNTK